MKLKHFTLLKLMLVTALFTAEAQNKKQKTNPFENSQYWLGLKGGINLTQASVTDLFTVYEPLDGNYSGYEKVYESFNQVGSQFQFTFIYSFHRFSITAAPGYKSVLYSYTNKYTWNDASTPSNQVELNYHQTQTIEYADLPVTLKFEFLSGKLRPYLHAGGFVSYKINARKSIVTSGTDNASGGNNSFENPPIISGASTLYNPWWFGAIGGIGLNYDLANVRVFLESNYRIGFNNITNPSKRFTENQFSGSGDALDNVSLSNLEINIGCVFPLKFLRTGEFRAVKPK